MQGVEVDGVARHRATGSATSTMLVGPSGSSSTRVHPRLGPRHAAPPDFDDEQSSQQRHASGPHESAATAESSVGALGAIRAVLSTTLTLGLLLLFWPPSLGGPVSFVIVSGHSMEPKYHTGDVVAAVDVPGRPYRVHDGDIKGNVVHQLVEQLPDGTFRTKGLNNPGTDPWQVPPDWIQGRVMAMVPQGYRILLIMKSPIFLAAMAGILITALLWPREHLDDAEE